MSLTSALPAVLNRPAVTDELNIPDGPGPFPAVVVLHGCNGISPHTRSWAHRVVDWGYVVLVMDSFGPRGCENVCGPPGRITHFDRALDAFAAANYLRGLGFVRPDRIGVIGFSHGGGSSIKATQRKMAQQAQSPPFRVAVAYYPWCDPSSHREVDVPLLILIGAKDDWTPASQCADLMRVLRRPELVSIKIYPDGFHSFDNLLPPREYFGHHLAHNAEAAADSVSLTKAFLDQYLKKSR